MDKDGNIAMPFCTEGMYRGFIDNSGKNGLELVRREKAADSRGLRYPGFTGRFNQDTRSGPKSLNRNSQTPRKAKVFELTEWLNPGRLPACRASGYVNLVLRRFVRQEVDLVLDFRPLLAVEPFAPVVDVLPCADDQTLAFLIWRVISRW